MTPSSSLHLQNVNESPSDDSPSSLTDTQVIYCAQSYISLFDALQLGSDSRTHSDSSVAMDNEELTEDREIIARGRSVDSHGADVALLMKSAMDGLSEQLDSMQSAMYEGIKLELDTQQRNYSTKWDDGHVSNLAARSHKLTSEHNNIDNAIQRLAARNYQMMLITIMSNVFQLFAMT